MAQCLIFHASVTILLEGVLMQVRNGMVVMLLAGAVSLAAFGQKSTTAPEKPIQLEASTDYKGATAIAVLKWRDMSDNELGFEVLRSDNGAEFRVVGMVGANTQNYQDRIGKYVSGGFSFKVRAFNEAGRSEESNQASVWF